MDKYPDEKTEIEKNLAIDEARDLYREGLITLKQYIAIVKENE